MDLNHRPLGYERVDLWLSNRKKGTSGNSEEPSGSLGSGKWELNGSRFGSGANARVAGDDEEMQRFVPIEDLFKGRHFDRQIIVLCVSWYRSFKLSLRDLVIMAFP